VNEIRFQYNRDNNHQTPLGTDPSINVIGAFNGGAAAESAVRSHRPLRIAELHVGSTGYAFSEVRRSSSCRPRSRLLGAGFNGGFTFPSIQAYQTAQQTLAGGATTAPGATQFTLNASPTGGIPTVSATVVDAGALRAGRMATAAEILRSVTDYV